MINKYEKATEELRQVRHEEWAHDYLLVYYKIQRKWLVQDGRPESLGEKEVPSNWGKVTSYDREIDASRVMYFPLQEEWRDLPEVKASEIITK